MATHLHDRLLALAAGYEQQGLEAKALAPKLVDEARLIASITKTSFDKAQEAGPGMVEGLPPPTAVVAKAVSMQILDIASDSLLEHVQDRLTRAAQAEQRSELFASFAAQLHRLAGDAAPQASLPLQTGDDAAPLDS
jgi:hypothetical protein